MRDLLLWRGGKEQRSLDTQPLLSYRQEPVALVHQAPALLVARTVADLRRAAPSRQEDPALRWAAILRAGDLLATADLEGVSAEEHARLITLATGTPITFTREGLKELAAGMSRIADALAWQAPGGELSAFERHQVCRPDGKRYGWVPVGQVLGFIAPSNHPAVHLTWVLALAMGYTVLIRPGADDPFTPVRVIQALSAAGFPTERVALLPGGHDLVPALIAQCDRTIAYGGSALAALLGQDGRVLFNGPGHSKVLVDLPAPLAAEQQVRLEEFLLDCITHDAGRKCTCASAVLVREGGGPGEDGAMALLAGVRDRLQALPLLEPLDPAARVPAWKEADAVRHTPARLVEVDGVAYAEPDLMLCADPTRPPFGAELPAPWVTAAVLPAGSDPVPLLRGSLAVTLLSPDRDLRERLLLEPTVWKLFTGPIPPWQTEPGAPHHGLLSDFLFVRKYAPEVAVPWS